MAVAETKPDLVLLDWMLPYVSGIEICRRLRRDPETRDLPVILLTARGEEDDRIRGLDSGADDYVVKPFSPSELVARVRAVMRRTRPAFDKDLLSYADIVMDLGSHRVSRGDRTIDLGPTEFRLLRFLLEHPGRVFNREQLLDGVWGQDAYIEPRTVDGHHDLLRIVGDILHERSGRDQTAEGSDIPVLTGRFEEHGDRIDDAAIIDADAVLCGSGPPLRAVTARVIPCHIPVRFHLL